MLLIQECYDHALHALNNPTELSPQLTLKRIVDTAGTFMFGCRSWNFANRIEGYSNLAAGSKYVDPPFGAVEILGATRADTLPYQVVFIPPAERARFVAFEQLGSSGLLTIFATPVYVPQDNDEPKLRLAVTPKPTTTTARGIIVAFKAGWLGIDLEDPAKTAAPIPKWAETLFIELVRAAAMGLEWDKQGTFSQRVADFEAWPSYVATKRQDDRLVSAPGQMRNTAIDMARDARRYPNGGDDIVVTVLT